MNPGPHPGFILLCQCCLRQAESESHSWLQDAQFKTGIKPKTRNCSTNLVNLLAADVWWYYWKEKAMNVHMSIVAMDGWPRTSGFELVFWKKDLQQKFLMEAFQWWNTLWKKSSCNNKWGLCALRHGIQISMEAILACHPARSTKWLDCHPTWIVWTMTYSHRPH